MPAGGRSWLLALLGLALVRAAVPLAALAASGEQLPGLPRYRYDPLVGDANGYYAALRELQAATGRVPLWLAVPLGGLFLASLVASPRVRRGRRPWVAVALPAAVAALALVLVIGEMDEAGAAVIGWPLVWGAAQLPFRALGVAPTPDVAFGFGLALSLAFLAVATVATGILALELTGRRSAGVLAAGLFALWPFVPAAVVGEGAWRNGSWTVDVGLALYTEPLSTMLVAVALVLVLRRRPSGDALVAAGLLVGLATAVKLSNGVIAALLLGALALRRPTGLGRDTLPFLAGALVSAPVVIAYWPKGYVGLFGGSIAPIPDPWGLDRVASAWTDSHVFRPVLLALLVPLVALGSWLVRDAYRLAVTLGPVLVTAGLYSAYAYTPEHPRFLYVALPPALALAAAGAVGLAAAARALVGREPEAASSRMPSPTTRGADGRRG